MEIYGLLKLSMDDATRLKCITFANFWIVSACKLILYLSLLHYKQHCYLSIL